jgi:hypothetical protein
MWLPGQARMGPGLPRSPWPARLPEMFGGITDKSNSTPHQSTAALPHQSPGGRRLRASIFSEQKPAHTDESDDDCSHRLIVSSLARFAASAEHTPRVCANKKISSKCRSHRIHRDSHFSDDKDDGWQIPRRKTGSPLWHA